MTTDEQLAQDETKWSTSASLSIARRSVMVKGEDTDLAFEEEPS